ncbi:hypothetical protein R2F25_34150 [Streptomyces sp. UP1A-1]|nr:hypothetical protein [Streptomyces sp. UP1A-1]
MTEVEVLQLLVSPAHRLAGRPADGPSPGPADERVDRVEVRAGLGLVGDRYYGRAGAPGRVRHPHGRGEAAPGHRAGRRPPAHPAQRPAPGRGHRRPGRRPDRPRLRRRPGPLRRQPSRAALRVDGRHRRPGRTAGAARRGRRTVHAVERRCAHRRPRDVRGGRRAGRGRRSRRAWPTGVRSGRR